MVAQIEKDIWQSISVGDELAYEALFKSHFAELTLYAMRFVMNMESAEEVVQDIFFNLWTKRDTLNISVSIKSYLYRTVKNTCLNIIKHQKIEDKYREHFSRELQTDELNADNWMVESELSDKITKAIEQLPPERKKVFILSRFEELKYREIAEKLNISIKTVENQMGKALKFLRNELKDYIPLLIFLLER